MYRSASDMTRQESEPPATRSMELSSVVATFTPLRDMRRAVLDELGRSARVTFLREAPEYDRHTLIASADAILGWNLRQELEHPEEFDLLGSVKLVQVLSAGADGLPLAWIPEGVPVASNAGGYARPMAEHVLAMALALAKHLSQRHRDLARGLFTRELPNRDIEGSTVGIIGFGGIGQATASLFRAFGASIYAITRSGQPDDRVDWMGSLTDLDILLGESDIVVLAIPLTNITHHLIGGRELSLMRDDAILINVARGPIVHELALFQHLVDHPNFSAGLDVWWNEAPGSQAVRRFLDLPNVLGSPHNSADTPRSLAEAARHAARNVVRALRGEPIRHVIDRSEYRSGSDQAPSHPVHRDRSDET